MSKLQDFVDRNGITLTYKPIAVRSKNGGMADANHYKCIIKSNMMPSGIVIEYSKGKALVRYCEKVKSIDYTSSISFTEAVLALRNKKFGERPQIPYHCSLVTQELFDHITEPEPPTVDEVMESLALDCSTVTYNQTFAEFCNELGYSEDSRQAYRIYKACQHTLWQMFRLLGPNAFTELTSGSLQEE